MEMSLSLLRNDLNSSEQHRLVRAVRNTFTGNPSGTPSPNILRFQDIGLLYFINQKQAKFHSVIASVDLDAHENLLPVRNLVTFVTTAVGWLIVEAERIDEAIIATQRELSNFGNELREKDMDLQYQSSHTGTEVHRAIAEHHYTRVNIPQRKHSRGAGGQFEQSQLANVGELPQQIIEVRGKFQAAKQHLKVLRTSQRLLHGNKNAEVPQVEADAIVADLSCLTTFRKAAHKVRDSVFGVPNREQLESISSLLEVFAYLDRGMTAALDDLEHCQMHLKKQVLLTEKQTRLDHLDEIDARNKQLSSAALRQNEELGQEISRVGGGGGGQYHSNHHASMMTGASDATPIGGAAGPVGGSHAASYLQSAGHYSSAAAGGGNPNDSTALSITDSPIQPSASPAQTPAQQQQLLQNSGKTNNSSAFGYQHAGGNGGRAAGARVQVASGPSFISPGGPTGQTPGSFGVAGPYAHHAPAHTPGTGYTASPASERGVSVASHHSEMEEFLQLYCS